MPVSSDYVSTGAGCLFDEPQSRATMQNKHQDYAPEDKTAPLVGSPAEVTTGFCCTTSDNDLNEDCGCTDKSLFNVFVVSPDGDITSALPRSKEVLIISADGVIVTHHDEKLSDNNCDDNIPTTVENSNINLDDTDADYGRPKITNENDSNNSPDEIDQVPCPEVMHELYICDPDDTTLHDFAVQTFEFEGYGCPPPAFKPTELPKSAKDVMLAVPIKKVCACSYCQKLREEAKITAKLIAQPTRTVAVGSIDMDGYATACAVQKSGNKMTEEDKIKLRGAYRQPKVAESMTKVTTSTNKEKIEYEHCDLLITTTVITRVEYLPKTMVTASTETASPPRPSTMPNPNRCAEKRSVLANDTSSANHSSSAMPGLKETIVTQKVEELPNLTRVCNQGELTSGCSTAPVMKPLAPTELPHPTVPQKTTARRRGLTGLLNCIEDRIVPFVTGASSLVVTATCDFKSQRTRNLTLTVDIRAKARKKKAVTHTLTVTETSSKAVQYTVLAERALMDILYRLAPWVWNMGSLIPLTISVDWTLNQYPHTSHYQLAPWLSPIPQNLKAVVEEWKFQWGLSINLLTCIN